MNCLAKKLSFAPLALALLTIFCAGVVPPAQAQTPTVLYNFTNSSSDVCEISGALAQGRDGNLYGAGDVCGANGTGGVFKITPAGVEIVLASFPSNYTLCGAGITLGSDGNFYGACTSGNTAIGLGTVYKVTTAGAFTALHDFTGTNGDAAPFTPIQASDGNFYGATFGDASSRCGNIYKMTPAGVETNVHAFTGFDCHPVASPIQAADGNLYGTLANCTLTGNRGCVYKISLTGTFSEFYGFVDATGSFPNTGVIQGKDGNFYGTTIFGGTSGSIGTVYKLTAAGVITVLHNTQPATDGNLTSILQASDGNFYGTAVSGGSGDFGTIYKLTPSKVFSAFSLDGVNTGSNPASPMIQHTSGLLYGTTRNGGGGTVGTFFSVGNSGPPFAKLGSLSGKIGAKVPVFGQGFSAASVVKFGGVTATAVVRTGTTFLTATVPAGALTGSVTVTTGTTTLTSSLMFKVKPNITGFTPPSGSIGSSVTISGTGLTQTTKVAFNGTSATFTVNSDIQITATVPTGATTGKISVTTKGGSASSSTNFVVN